MYVKIFVTILIFISFSRCQNTTDIIEITNTTLTEDDCPSIRNSDVTLGGPHCCNRLYRLFRQNYNNLNLRLTSFLERLRAWDCSQFEVECENRYFQFNRFTSLVYDRFCNETAFTENCQDELSDINAIYNFTGGEGEISNETLYSEIIFSSPCLQVNAYEYGQIYAEIARPLFAFCDSVWCGFNENTLTYHQPSVWLCIPSSCRASIIIVITVCCILAVAVTVANLTVLIVIMKNPRCPTSQMVYKLSLATADLLVGLFVYPSFAATLYRIQIAPFETRPVAFDEELSNSTSNSSLIDICGEFDPAANVFFRPENNTDYNAAFGFFTAVSIMVSVSTLMFASYDRFRAISTPLSYEKSQATKTAQRATFVLWIVAIFLGILPIILSEIRSYRILAGGVLIGVNEEESQIMHVIALGVPFIIVWVLTVGVNVIVKRQTKYRVQLMSRKQNQDSKNERRLTKTLSIMVGVFTACVLPAIIFVAVPEAIPSINAENITVLARKPASAFITLELAMVILLASNSLWNCFIYSFRNKEFRKDAANLHFKIMSALGLVWVKRTMGSCLYKTAHDGRRRISSVFTATTALSDLRKKSVTPSLDTETEMSNGMHQANTSKSKDVIASSVSTSGLNSYL